MRGPQKFCIHRAYGPDRLPSVLGLDYIAAVRCDSARLQKLRVVKAHTCFNQPGAYGTSSDEPDMQRLKESPNMAFKAWAPRLRSTQRFGRGSTFPTIPRKKSSEKSCSRQRAVSAFGIDGFLP